MTIENDLFTEITAHDLRGAVSFFAENAQEFGWKKQKVRFAPSPTGLLHLGNIYSALYTQHIGKLLDADIILRIEDIDPERCRPEFEDDIYSDMARIGFNYHRPVMRQSERVSFYQDKINELWVRGLIYPCFCSRKDIREHLKEMDSRGESIKIGVDGPYYPRTCCSLTKQARQIKIDQGVPFNLRLDCKATARWLQEHQGSDILTWQDLRKGVQKVDVKGLDDVVIARKDCGTSYHASVVLDDAAQEITVITRGEDLFETTHIHRVLQALWGLPTPFYDHHDLIYCTDHNDPNVKKKLSKQFKSKPLSNYSDDEYKKALSTMTALLK